MKNSHSAAVKVVTGFCLAALAFELFSFWLGHTISHDLADVVVPLKQEWIENGRANADIVFLGDSFVKSGIEPAAVRSVTGRSTINLGTNIFVTLYGQRFMLKRLLAAHTPRLVVILADTAALAQEIRSEEGRYYLAKEFIQPSEIRYLYAETHDASLLLSQLFNLFLPLPSLYYRNVVQGALGNVLRALPARDWNKLKTPGYPVDRAVQAFEENDGLFPLEHDTVTVEASKEQPFSVNPPVSRQLDQMLELCRSRDVLAAFGFSPVPLSVDLWWRDHGQWNGIHEFERDLRTRHPEVIFLEPLLRVYPDEEFYDRRHLLRLTARAHSEWIARQLMPRVSGLSQP